jgi:uridine phosphorylase
MSDMEPKPSEVVKSSSGRQYHTDLAPGDLADYILLIVDPARVARVVDHLDQVTLERANREFRSYTGHYRGVPISVICTGIGQDNTEMVFVEALLVSTGPRPAMIRVGSCGGLRQDVALGDLVISTGAVRLESTSTYFVDEGYPAVPHYEVTMALIAAADKTGQPYHVGLNASAAGFYGAQGREVAGLKPKNPGSAERLAAWNVLNMEMESSTQPFWRQNRHGWRGLFQPCPR